MDLTSRKQSAVALCLVRSWGECRRGSATSPGPETLLEECAAEPEHAT
jgi:hypothetical protein